MNLFGKLKIYVKEPVRFFYLFLLKLSPDGLYTLELCLFEVRWEIFIRHAAFQLLTRP